MKEVPIWVANMRYIQLRSLALRLHRNNNKLHGRQFKATIRKLKERESRIIIE